MENEKHITDSVINELKNEIINLESLQVQFALGKADAKDKIEEYKQSFREKLHNAKLKLMKGESKLGDLKSKFEHLELQLTLGKAELKDEFEEQKKNITKGVHDLIHFLDKNL